MPGWKNCTTHYITHNINIMTCEDFLIYPGNRLLTTIEANIENEDGTSSELDLEIYDTINIMFKKNANSEALITLSTESGEGLSVSGNIISIDKEIDDTVPIVGNVMFDIECINNSGTVTYGPGFAKIVKKITNIETT